MDKLFAILGDIHSNLDALTVVLEDCRREGVTDFLCTGDVVGYNACPHECLQLIRELGCPVVMGNHDQYVSHKSGFDLSDFNPAAAAVVEWTRKQLSVDEVYWLRDLPFSVCKQGIALVHATLDQPEKFGYVFDPVQAKAHFVHQVPPLCFHGHTHCPTIYEKQMGDVLRYDPHDYRLPSGGRKCFINVGSVGQPRDGDPRAAYVLYDPKARLVRFRRLEYDVAAAQARIRAAGLPERLAMRLAVGQ